LYCRITLYEQEWFECFFVGVIHKDYYSLRYPIIKMTLEMLFIEMILFEASMGLSFYE